MARGGRKPAPDLNSRKESGMKHVPVMGNEVLSYLSPLGEGYRLVDGTVGLGGHSSLVLRESATAEVLGIDRDGEALKEAEKALEFAGARKRLVRGTFGTLAEQVIGTGWLPVDAVLLDLGVSSPQIDSPERGFSTRFEGPLDMRMDDRSGTTAARILNNSSEKDLAMIFRDYGGIRESRKLASAVVVRRLERPWSGTGELVELCRKVLVAGRKRSIPPATLCFQALRIAVNDELGELERGLRGAWEILRCGGKIAVICFHSLEDRIVKNFFRREASGCLCPPGLPECICGHKPTLRILTKKPVGASDDEVFRNPRAASARLRVAEKI
ncbi:MAG: 16S rRNA (cytosine(1402)-N(4))-methyltransferase RsmH [Victivallales bacterium]|nr:16S rRNA (cytosine(1402)-N(4))-methyltransferase RsmH [Victivallales bacterium]